MKTTTVSVYAAFFFILVLSVSCRRDSEAPDVAFQKIEMCMESLPDTALYLLKSVPHPEKLRGKSQADYAYSMFLYKEERNGADYIRIEYVNSQAVALLLAQDTDVEKTGNSSAYIPATAFKLPDFYDRYSPHVFYVSIQVIL